MKRALWFLAAIAMSLIPSSVAAQEVARDSIGPWAWRLVVFVVSLPYTMYMVFVDGQRLHLLPAPLLVAALSIWSFGEWRRQRFWTPRIIHVLSVLGLATIIAINVDWVRAGGEMWTQRYVVIAVFGLFPYVAYLVFLGPRFLGRRSAPVGGGSSSPIDAFQATADRRRGRWRTTASAIGPGRIYGLVGGVLLVVTLGLMNAAVRAGPTSTLRPELDVLHAPESVVPMARGVAKGDADAPFTIFVFVDYQCPGCGKFSRQSQAEIDRALVDAGVARMVVFDLPLVSLHDNAFLAARAAHCAEDQEGFWAYQNELFRTQGEWSRLGDPRSAFGGAAESAGMDVALFRTCLDGDRHTERVNANGELADRLGIRNTPTIVISRAGGGSWVVGERTFEAIMATIEELDDADTAQHPEPQSR